LDKAKVWTMHFWLSKLQAHIIVTSLLYKKIFINKAKSSIWSFLRWFMKQEPQLEKCSTKNTTELHTQPFISVCKNSYTPTTILIFIIHQFFTIFFCHCPIDIDFKVYIFPIFVYPWRPVCAFFLSAHKVQSGFYWIERCVLYLTKGENNCSFTHIDTHIK